MREFSLGLVIIAAILIVVSIIINGSLFLLQLSESVKDFWLLFASIFSFIVILYTASNYIAKILNDEDE
jgi:hypothetical protein